MYADSNVLKLSADITYQTLAGAITAVQGLYRYLDAFAAGSADVFSPRSGKKRYRQKGLQKARVSFLYGQIYEVDMDEIIDLSKITLKDSGFKKHWLSGEEKTGILNTFRTLRDKAIFLLLCEGMRIDEVLSIKYSAYDSVEKTVRPARSKGYSTGYEDKMRIVAFHDERTSQYLNRYIETERADVEDKLNDYLEPLFVNLKNHPDSIGKPVGYKNYWRLLKSAVERAGLKPSEIATHVGRRTFVQEKLDEGEDSEIIRQMLGWASLSPLDSYRDLQSKTAIKNAANARRKHWKNDKPAK